MKKLFLLIIMICALQGAAYAQTFEQVVEKFEDKKGAEVLKVPGVLMKMALAFADEDEDMPREAIQPGDYADLTLSFDPRGEWGVIGNYINILTSTPGSEVVMWISAEIGSI